MPRTVHGDSLSRSIQSAAQWFLVGGDKSGGGEKRFYRQLIAKADERFNKHLIEIRKEERKNV